MQLTLFNINDKVENLLTKKVVFPIWQSPNKLILRLTKSESEPYPLFVCCCCSCEKPSSTVVAEWWRFNLRYWAGLGTEQSMNLFQKNRKKCPTKDTLCTIPHRTSTWTIFRQSCDIFFVVSLITFAIEISLSLFFRHRTRQRRSNVPIFLFLFFMRCLVFRSHKNNIRDSWPVLCFFFLYNFVSQMLPIAALFYTTLEWVIL